MSGFRITRDGGLVTLAEAATGGFIFDFPPEQASISRQGDNLVIEAQSGKPTIIEKFFAINGQDNLPAFTLADGTTLNGIDFLQTFSPDLVTASGPAASAAASSSGVGEYQDGAGTLIGGVDSLDAIDGMPGFASGVVSPEYTASSAFLHTESGAAVPGQTWTEPAPAVPGPAPTPPAPGQPQPQPEPGPQPEPEPQPGANFRFVVYGDEADDASWAQGVSGYLPVAGGIVAVSEGLYGSANILADGAITYVPAPGQVWPADGSPLVEHITLSLADGSQKVLEVLVVNGTSYDASGSEYLGGEWHEGTVEGAYTQATTGANDFFVRQTGNTGLNTGSLVNMGSGDDAVILKAGSASGLSDSYGAFGSSKVVLGDGNDRVQVSAESASNAYGFAGKSLSGTGSDRAVVDMGDGDDALSVSAKAGANGYAFGLLQADVGMGDGNDTLDVSVKGYTAYGVAKGSHVELGNGDNTMIVNAESTSRYAYGIYSDTNGPRTSISAGDGDDTLRVTAQGKNSITVGVSNADITFGGGNNLIDITTVSTGSGKGMEKATVTVGDGDDVIRVKAGGSGSYGIDGSTILLGQGNNLLTVDANSGIISSRIESGAGKDTIIIEHSGTGANYGIAGYSAVNTGDGDDSIRIALKGGNGSEALRTGSVTMGSGNDTFDASVSGNGATGGLNDGARLVMGDGDDTVTIKVDTTSFLAFGAHNGSSITLGDGNDTVNISTNAISQTSADIYSYGLASNVVLDAGNGNDTVNIKSVASVKGKTAEADGAVSAAIKLGEGDNSLSLNATATGQAAIARGAHSLYTNVDAVTAGSGDDVIVLNTLAHGVDSALASGLSNVTLSAGAGRDSLTISSVAEGGNASAYGLQGATVNMGSGDDILHISSSSDGMAYGLSSGVNGYGNTRTTVVNMGDGNDTINLSVHAGTDAYGINNSSLVTSGGDNTISIDVAGAHGSYGLYGATVQTGAGSDYINIHAGSNGEGVALHNSTLDLGAGNDTLVITGAITGNSHIVTGGGNDVLHIDGAVSGNSVIDAGGDNDVVILGGMFTLADNAALKGGGGMDTLILGDDLSQIDFTQHTGKITGFEGVDLTHGGKDITLSLDDVLSLTTDASGSGKGEPLRIFSDGDDTVRLTGTGWAISPDSPVTLTGADGHDQTFYSVTNGDISVYIDAQMDMAKLLINCG